MRELLLGRLKLKEILIQGEGGLDSRTSIDFMVVIAMEIIIRATDGDCRVVALGSAAEMFGENWELGGKKSDGPLRICQHLLFCCD